MYWGAYSQEAAYFPDYTVSSIIFPFLARNQQIRQLGYPRKSDDADTSQVMEYIHSLNFDLLHMTPYFDHGLVLMKRRLCWTLDKILYRKLRKSKHRTKSDMLPDAQNQSVNFRTKFKEWSKADYMLYEFTNQSFWDQYNKEPRIDEEVAYFKKVRDQLTTFCPSKKKKTLVVPASEWNEEFTITKDDCNLMKVYDVMFRRFFRLV